MGNKKRMKLGQAISIIVLLGETLFTGCQRCATCEQTTTTSTQYGSQSVTTNFRACGKQLRDIKHKKANSTANAYSGGSSANVTTTTVCY